MRAEPPAFRCAAEFLHRLADATFWHPWLAQILARHGLATGAPPRAGVGSTHPTFICGDVVVKLFGGTAMWRASHAAETAIHRVLAREPVIAAPRLLAQGTLFDDEAAPWPYLVTGRMVGLPWEAATLRPEAKLAVAHALGRQIGRLHRLAPDGVAAHEDWRHLDVEAANARSSLPPRLVAGIDDYLAGIGACDRVLVHGDLMGRHVFVAGERLAGMIDWGDAMVTDRHYELAKLHLDLFDGDKRLLRAFLDGSDWPVTGDFARRAMAFALHRQAHGLAQHHGMDVFFKVPAMVQLDTLTSLDELATALFEP